jgi:hypothetical protein
METWGECLWTARDLIGPEEEMANLWAPDRESEDIPRRTVIARVEDVDRWKQRRGRLALATKSFVAGAAAALFLVVGSGYPSPPQPVLVDREPPAPTVPLRPSLLQAR